MPPSKDTEDQIRKVLSDLQAGPGIDTAISAFINPMRRAKPGIDGIVDQFDWAVQQIHTWRSNDEIASWVIPKPAALAFMSTLATCVSYWAAFGIPVPVNSLKPEVDQFVKIQAKVFAAALGGS